MRKSKYDLFIYYDAVSDSVFEMIWDMSEGGVPHWFCRDGKKTWLIKGREALSYILSTCVLLDRVPEGIARNQG